MAAGSDASAAGGRKSELSEWQWSIADDGLQAEEDIGYHNRIRSRRPTEFQKQNHSMAKIGTFLLCSGCRLRCSALSIVRRGIHKGTDSARLRRDAQCPLCRLLFALLRLAKSRPAGGCSLALRLRALILPKQEKGFAAIGIANLNFKYQKDMKKRHDPKIMPFVSINYSAT